MTLQDAPLSRQEVRTEYAQRLEQRRIAQRQFDRRHFALGRGRVATFLVGGVMAWLTFGRGLFSAWWLLVPALVFLTLAVIHDRVLHRLERARRAVAFYEKGLERLEGRWAGRGASGVRFSSATHPYAEDLDIFGRGSLFELLCTARTQAGEACLAAWLSSAAGPDTVRARQAAVTELRPMLDLREDLALLGEEMREVIDPKALATWGEEPPQLTSRGVRLAAAFCTVALVLALLGRQLAPSPLPFALLVGLLILGGQFLALSQRKAVAAVTQGIDKPARDLEVLASLLSRLERERFQAPLLQELRAGLDLAGEPPSARIGRLQTLVAWLDAMRNQFFALIGVFLLWNLQISFFLEAWRARNGPYVARWLEAIGVFEALSALAAYAYENPDDPFPEILDRGVSFEAEAMAHPLLSQAHAIRNDLRLGPEGRLFIVSGSNMSGKSTLLRTIGVNTVLALAGGPVRAKRLRLSSVHLGASLRTQDSLQTGVSLFYAEITRLRQIVDIGRENPPLLFLLDEILHGTNSHDRRVGAEAVLRALIRDGAVGLVTTHDLALARMAEDPALAAVNVHFQDDLVDGKMHFDYRLRPGIVEKSNAIELMRAVGLEV